MPLSPEAQAVWDKTYSTLRDLRVRNCHFECRPRYTCGSGALVAEAVCCKEAVDEQEAYRRHLSGVYGEEHKAKAEKLGLKWICFARWQKGKKVYRYDLITGDTIEEPKELTYDEMMRVLTLRNWKLHGITRWGSDLQTELDTLEERAAMHRQEIKK